MNTGQGLLCLAVGAGALIGGVAMSLPAAPALGASALAIAVSGQSLSAIGGALAGNVTQSGLQKSYSAVAKRLMAGREAARLPQNHDLIRSLRLSQLDAIKYISESFHQEIAKDTLHPDGEYQHSSRTEFRNTINSYVRAEIKRYSNRKLDFDDQWLATLGKENQEIEEKLQPADQFSVASSLEWLAGTASKAALDEIVGALGKNKIALNDDFRDWYQGRFGSTGFAYAAHQFFAERMKTDERLRTAVFSMSFETIEHQGRHALEILSRLDCKLDGMDNSLSSRFDALEEQIKMLAPSNQLLDIEGFMDRLLHASASNASPEDLRSIVRSTLPHDNWIGSTASHDVSARIERLLYRSYVKDGPLMPAFFGRNDQLSLLHDWIDGNDKGLAVICAQSGGGKSALLARLCQDRRRIGDTVIRHFVSLQMPSTTSPASALSHLLAQIREIDRVDPDDREMRIPAEEAALKDALHKRLEKPMPSGERMIVVIDALDELDTAFVDTFVRSDMAPGHFVIVSHRAEPDVTPHDLRCWMSAESAPGVPAKRFDLPGMKAEELVPWLEERIGDLSASDMRRICDRLHAVTDGVPLFLRYLIEILIEDFQRVTKPADRLALIDNLSDPFAGFLKVYLDGEPERSVDKRHTITGRRAFSLEEKLFLALLTQTLGPISEMDVRAALKCHEARSGQSTSVDISNLDRLVSRWLSYRTADKDSPDQSARISFDHPRLAIEFATAIGNSLTRSSLSSLLFWGQEAWKPTTDGILDDVIRGAEYPVWRHPEHLLKLGKADEAAALLMNIDFIEERFWTFEGRQAADLMVRDWTEWHRQNTARKQSERK